jgi:hypothetical protein
MASGNIADRHARLQRLFDDQEVLLRRKPPPAATPVMTSTFENVSDIGVCLGAIVNDGAVALARPLTNQAVA